MSEFNLTHPCKPRWLIHHIFGKRHWCSGYVNELCEADSNFLLHLSEQTESYVHYLCLVRLGWDAHKGTVPPVVKQAEMLMRQTQRKVLGSLYPRCPPGLIHCLGRLGGRPLSRQDYRRLLSLLEAPGKRRFLEQTRRIHSYHLHWLESYPDHLLHWRVLNSIRQSRQYNSLKYIINVVRQLEDSGAHAEVLTSIRRIKTLKELESWLENFVRTLDFPPPPWPGNDWIKPVESVKALKDVSLEFKNCLYSYRRSILLGCYCYCSTRGPAVIGIRKDPLLGWLIDDINGTENQKPPRSVQAAITQALVRGFDTEVMELSSDDWWDGDIPF